MQINDNTDIKVYLNDIKVYLNDIKVYLNDIKVYLNDIKVYLNIHFTTRHFHQSYRSVCDRLDPDTT